MPAGRPAPGAAADTGGGPALRQVLTRSLLRRRALSMSAAWFSIAHTLLAAIVKKNRNTRACAQLLLVLTRIFSTRR